MTCRQKSQTVPPVLHASAHRHHQSRTRIYRASKRDCLPCALKERCCSGQSQRKVVRSIHEASRDLVRRLRETPDYQRSRRERKKVEMPFAPLKRILKMGRLRLRGPSGAKDEFTLAAIAQNWRKLARCIGWPAANCQSVTVA